jgi:hypothetical protein
MTEFRFDDLDLREEPVSADHENHNPLAVTQTFSSCLV